MPNEFLLTRVEATAQKLRNLNHQITDQEKREKNREKGLRAAAEKLRLHSLGLLADCAIRKGLIAKPVFTALIPECILKGSNSALLEREIMAIVTEQNVSSG